MSIKQREREAERQKKRSFRAVHARLLLGHSKKKLVEREKQGRRKNLFSPLFFTPGRTTIEMLVEQRVEWKINVSILVKKRSRKTREKKEKKLFSSFKYLYIGADIHRYIYIYRYIFPSDINQKKKKKYLQN